MTTAPQARERLSDVGSGDELFDLEASLELLVLARYQSSLGPKTTELEAS